MGWGDPSIRCRVRGRRAPAAIHPEGAECSEPEGDRDPSEEGLPAVAEGAHCSAILERWFFDGNELCQVGAMSVRLIAMAIGSGLPCKYDDF